MCWLLDTEITERRTEAGTGLFHADKGIEDGAIVSGLLANASYALLDVSLALPSSYPAPQDLEVEMIGPGSWVRIDAYRQKIAVYTAKETTSAKWGSQPVPALLEEFINTALRDSPAAGLHDALRAQGIALSVLALRSLAPAQEQKSARP